MTGERDTLTVPSDVDGRRLDRFLTETHPDRTRSAVGRVIRAGHVRVDGRPALKPGTMLRGGCRVDVVWPPAPSPTALPEALEIDLLYEDEHLAVVNKAAGMVVHQGHGNRTGTLVNALLGRGLPLAAAGGAQRPGIVHRLDAGTSGTLVVAKTDEVHRQLAAAFAERRVGKRYVALVWGRPSPDEGRIERAIGRSRTHPTRMAITGTRGARRPALTLFRTRETMPGFALLDLELHTGRTHQIRVHLQSIHHPIVGDDRYGGRGWRGVQDPIKRKAIREFEHLALHAARLEFVHPVTGRRCRFKAPLPPAIEALLAALREPA